MPENLPPGVTGQEDYFAEEAEPRVCAVASCSKVLCERALDLGENNCCDCDGRTGCPFCYPDENGEPEENDDD